jgi:hypothetical protein
MYEGNHHQKFVQVYIMMKKHHKKILVGVVLSFERDMIVLILPMVDVDYEVWGGESQEVGKM